MSSSFILRNLPSRAELEKLRGRFPGMDVGAVEVFLSLMRLAADLSEATDGQLRRHGLSQGALSVLFQISRSPEAGIAPSELADAIGVARPTITGLLDGLERRRLARRAGAVDRRSCLVRLTPAGRRLVRGVMPDRLRWIASVVEPLSSKERGALLALLRKLSAGGKR